MWNIAVLQIARFICTLQSQFTSHHHIQHNNLSKSSLHFYCFCLGAVDCIDREGHRVRNGERFAPDEDPCKTCYCVDGIAQLCTLVQCSPPACPKWEPISNQCCKFRCLDWPHISGNNNRSSQGNSLCHAHSLYRPMCIIKLGQLHVVLTAQSNREPVESRVGAFPEVFGMTE